MRTLGIAAIAAIVAVLVPVDSLWAQDHQHHHAAAAAGAPAAPPNAAPMAAMLAENLGNLHHPVSTTNAEAQKFFDQGLTLVYAFNHDEAIKAFRHSGELDPKLGMAHWGIALALGPNYNVGVDAEREKQAFDEINKARELAKNANAPQAERDYIEALAARFSGDEKPDLKQLAQNYANSMNKLSMMYPDDLDAATLYADAMMNLRPWKLYTADGKPVEGTEKLVSVLESVLKKDPDHIGANHLYIHAVEASTTPHRAMEAAARLPTLAPNAGHLVHMPSHIYARVGDWDAAATSNEAAIAVDEAFIKANAPTGVYPLMYYNHNIHFLSFASMEAGQFAEAKEAADKLASHAGPHVAEMPMLEAFTPVPMMVQIRFQKFDDVLKTPEPSAGMPVTRAMWHFARGSALAAKGDADGVRKERDALAAAAKLVPADQMYGLVNKATDVVKIAQHVLDSHVASLSGKKDEAVKHLQEAIAGDDALGYIEPPDWLLPGRESLGEMYLADKQYDKAEKTFREQLDRTPRSGRSLFGLWKALDAQGKKYDAEFVHTQFKAAWKGADVQLSDTAP